MAAAGSDSENDEEADGVSQEQEETDRVSQDEEETEPAFHAPTLLSPEHAHALDDHYKRHFGSPPQIVSHEIALQNVHIDVFVYPATEQRPWITLVTQGMSGTVMPAPSGMEHFTRYELVLYLAADWDFDGPLGELPIHILRYVAHFPSEAPEEWLWYGHTLEWIQRPLVPGTLLTDLYFRPPVEEESFYHLDLPGECHTHFLWVIPVTEPECYLIRTDGSDAFDALLLDADYRVLDVDRESFVGRESRAQRRARAKAQRKRSRLPRRRPLSEVRCSNEAEHGHGKGG